MASFIWNTVVKKLPAEWRATRGQGVRVGIIDSGILLGHPALRHFDKPGYKFDARLRNPTGDDDVTDCRPVGKPHGTSCASIVGGLPAAADGVEGIAPGVELFVFRALNIDCDPTLELFMRGLKAAIAKDVDILSVSMTPLPDQNISQADIDGLFRQLAQKNIAFFSALRNTSSWQMLHRIPFPASRPETITVGVATPTLLENMPPDGVPSSRINLLAPQCPVSFYADMDDPAPQQDVLRSSFATAAMAGIAALALAHARKKAGDPKLRLSKDALLTSLQSIASPFSQQAMLNESGLQFFFNQP
jgi:hypothetical protein